jgi:4-amino-4-deoxy-L-arabinose transferase-like glycosyltransferase
VALAVAILLLAWRFFGKPAAIVAALLAAVTPVLVALEHALLPDFLFGVLLLAGAAALAEAVRREQPDWRFLILAGALFGASAWVKPIGQALLVAAPIALLASTRALRPALKGTAIATLALVVVITPWIVRNAVKHDFPAMSIQGGQTLFVRVYEIDETPLPEDSRDGRFAQRVEDRIDRGEEDERLHFALVRDLMRERGISDHDAILIEQRLALTGVWRDPLRYIVKTWPRLSGIADDIREFEDEQILLDDLDRTDPPFPTAVTAAIWDAAKVLNEIWWFGSLFTAAGLALLVVGTRERRSAAAALWSAWLAVALGTAMFEGGTDWRYSMELAPLTWILGSGGIAAIVHWAWTRAR